MLDRKARMVTTAKLIVSGLAILMFAISAWEQKNAESLGWCLLCVLWALG